MNSKKNSFKRVAAGALAVLTVAAYTAPVANVGGLPSVNVLTAEAAHSAIVSSTSLKNTTLEVGDYFAKDVSLKKSSNDTTTNIKLEFDGNFEVGVLKATNADEFAFDKTSAALLENIDPDTGVLQRDYGSVKVDGGYTIEDVQSIAYYEKNTAGANAKVLKVITKTAGKQYTYIVRIKDANAETLANMYVRVKTANEGTITFEKVVVTEDTKNHAIKLDDDARKYIESISYTTVAGDSDILYAKTIKSMGGPTAKDRTTVTIVANALLDITVGASKHEKVAYSNGKFTYTFDAIENSRVSLVERVIDGPADLKVKRLEDEKLVDYSGETPVYAGSTITLTSANPFTIENGTIKSQKTNGTFTYDDVTAEYKDGAFTATFLVSDTEGQLDVEAGDLDNVTFKYNVSGQKVTATGTDLDKNVIVKDATVASFSVTSKVPQYSDATKKVFKKDNKGNPIYTETAITSGKSIKYNPDRNAYVEADFTIDPNLLGAANNDGAIYKIEVSNGTVMDTYTFIDDIDGVADEAGENDPKSIVVKTKEETNERASDGIELNEAVEGTPSFAIKMQDAGSYTINLYVWGKDNTAAAKKVTLSYTISKITSISASDFTLRAFYTKDGVADGGDIDKYEELREAYVAALDNNAVTAEGVAAAKEALDNFVEDNSLVITKNSSNVYEVGADAKKLDENNSVWLYAELADGTPCEIITTKSLGKIGAKSASGTKIKVTDSNYSVSDVSISWKLVAATVEDAIMFDISDVPEEQLVGDCVPASYETLESTVKQYLKSTNKIDVKNATFKYTTVESNDGLVDIDTLVDGLPTGDTAHDLDTTYFIYAYVGEYETADPLPIVIQQIDTKVQAILSKTTFTYGEDIEPSDFKFVKAGTNTVIDGLAFREGEEITTNACVGDVVIRKNSATGAIVYNDNAIVDAASFVEDHLIPGKYYVTVSYTDNADQYINQAGYTFEDPDEKTNDGNGHVASKSFTITVNKKNLDGSMIVYEDDDEIITKQIINGVAKVTADDFDFVDGNNDIPVRINGKTSTADAPGTYVVNLAVNNVYVQGNAGPKWGDLYTGTIDVTWAAQKDENAFADFEFDYEINEDDLEDYIHDNIYSENNKVYIHTEAKLMKDATPGAQEELTTAEEKKINIKSIGFVYEKEGKLKDLTNSVEDIEEATKSLQLGVCKSTNVGTQKNSNLIAGINSTVTSIDDYIWVRPYVVTTEGVVKYGTARRLDFTTVANKVIAPQLSDPQLVGKTVKGTAGIYNYAYASKNTKNDVIYRTADPKAFGVVISREGNYAAEIAGIDIKGLYEQALAEGTYFDERAIINDIDDNDKKAAAKKYIAELKKAYSLTLDTADVSSKAYDNDNYTSDECGTLIKITDSLSRVYVRTYVDFGNGLVVYSAPKSIESANSLLAQELFGLTTAEGAERGNHTYPIAAVRFKTNDIAAAPDANTLKNVAQVFEPIKVTNVGSTAAAKQNQVSEFGLLLDTKGIVCADNYDKNNFVLGNGFDVRKSSKPNESNTNAADLGVDYESSVVFGGITAWGNKASARAYLVYRGVTFYGDVQSNQY